MNKTGKPVIEDTKPLTLAEQRVMNHVAKLFTEKVLIEQRWLEEFVGDFTFAVCHAYGHEGKLTTALQERLGAITSATSSHSQSTRERLVSSALSAANASRQRRP